MKDEKGVDNPRVWCFTAGEPTEDTFARFGMLTRMGMLEWIIVPVMGVDEFDVLSDPDEYANL